MAKNKKLDELIAKVVMGYKGDWKHTPIDSKYLWEVKENVWEDFSPTSSLNDALEVVKARGYNENFYLIGLDDGHWMCDIWSEEEHDWVYRYVSEYPALAVCYAILQAEGIDIGESV